jgi:hypothetical protein
MLKEPVGYGNGVFAQTPSGTRMGSWKSEATFAVWRRASGRKASPFDDELYAEIGHYHAHRMSKL